jgi:predicted phosphoribosyltransferase
MIITKLTAVLSLVGGQVSTSDYETFEYNSGQTPPTSEEIQTEYNRLIAEYDSQEYARNRKAEYPDIGDQLDMIYHNGDGGATFQAAIKAVKDKYPKE